LRRDKNYVKTETQLKIQEKRTRTQDFILIHSSSRATSNFFFLQQAKKFY